MTIAQRFEQIAEAIRQWQRSDKSGYDEAIGLLCEAEGVLSSFWKTRANVPERSISSRELQRFSAADLDRLGKSVTVTKYGKPVAVLMPWKEFLELRRLLGSEKQ